MGLIPSRCAPSLSTTFEDETKMRSPRYDTYPYLTAIHQRGQFHSYGFFGMAATSEGDIRVPLAHSGPAGFPSWKSLAESATTSSIHACMASTHFVFLSPLFFFCVYMQTRWVMTDLHHQLRKMWFFHV